MHKPAGTDSHRTKSRDKKRDAIGGENIAQKARGRLGMEPAPIGRARLEAVLDAAGSRGFLAAKTGRISGRVSPVLIEKAKQATGLATDTALIEFALASVALEDHFAEVLIAARGTVDPDLKLGF